MDKIIITGKGGIGKSFLAVNLGLSFVKKGYRVLHVGCDPKCDSTISILEGKKQKTIIEILRKKSRGSMKKEDFIMKGLGGIDCIEAGGPEPGMGCAGHGITVMFELLKDLDVINENDYDIVIYDLLGDVVCGGFAAPFKFNFGEKVIVVISEEFMSLYAANNICKAIKKYEQNGVYLCGLVLNQRDNTMPLMHLKRFAKELNTKFLGKIPRSRMITVCEFNKLPFIYAYPKSKIAEIFSEMSGKILNLKKENTEIMWPIDNDTFNKTFNVRMFL